MSHQLRVAQSGSGLTCHDHSAVVTRGDEVSTTCQPDLADLGDVHGIICEERKANNSTVMEEWLHMQWLDGWSPLGFLCILRSQLVPLDWYIVCHIHSPGSYHAEQISMSASLACM